MITNSDQWKLKLTRLFHANYLAHEIESKFSEIFGLFFSVIQKKNQKKINKRNPLFLKYTKSFNLNLVKFNWIVKKNLISFFLPETRKFYILGQGNCYMKIFSNPGHDNPP